jgi:ABC-type antimicrobial peptide transport system permease subunit
MRRAYHPALFALGLLLGLALAFLLSWAGADGLDPVVASVTDAKSKLDSIVIGVIAILSALLTIAIVVLVHRRLSS